MSAQKIETRSLEQVVKHILSVRENYLNYPTDALPKSADKDDVNKAKNYIRQIQEKIRNDKDGTFVARYLKTVNDVLISDLKKEDVGSGWQMSRAVNMLSLTDPAYKNKIGKSANTSERIAVYKEHLSALYGKGYSLPGNISSEFVTLENNIQAYKTKMKASDAAKLAKLFGETTKKVAAASTPPVVREKPEKKSPNWGAVASIVAVSAGALMALYGVGRVVEQVKDMVKTSDNTAQVQREMAQRKQLIEKVNAGRTDVRVLKETSQGLQLNIAATTSNIGRTIDTSVNKSTLGIIKATMQEVKAEGYCPVKSEADISDTNQFKNLKSLTDATGSSGIASVDGINIVRNQGLKATQERVQLQLQLQLEKCAQVGRG